MARPLDMNLANLIAQNAEFHADAVALSLGAQPHASYGQLARRVRAIAHNLHAAHGLAPDVEALDNWCLDHLARFKRPRAYIFLDNLPKNPSGKIAKIELRRLAVQD